MLLGPRKRRPSLLLPLSAAMAAVLSSLSGAATYYVSPTGSDSNSGLDASSPWQTVGKVNETTFDPGSQILFQRGGEWRESLIASSSGAVGQPITYDAYGIGAKPKFWGSDVLAKSSFQLLSGSTSTYQTNSDPVYSVLIDHQFTHSAELLTSNADPAVNIAYVKKTPQTWYYNSGKIYLNTGGVNPVSDPRTYTASVREDVVSSFLKDHLVFRNLVVDESARYNSGYGFRIQSSDDVLIESSEAYRAGKHNFGIINSSGFVGKNLYSSYSMPDQGYGGASAYVSYSDATRSGDTSQWIDNVFENANGDYPGFITHGPGIGSVLVRNMVVHGGAGMGLYSDGASIRVEGGLVENGPVAIGSNTVVDGMTVTGPYGSFDLIGNDSIIENSTVSGRAPDYWAGHRAAIADAGHNNTIRYNTIILDPDFSGRGAAIGINSASTNSHIYGNVLTDQHVILLYAGQAPLDMHDNLFPVDSNFAVMQPDGAVPFYSLAQWQQMGYELRLAMPGDADFDGDIDADDFALIDQAFATRNALAGFHNGDFNFSGGVPDADDYFIIDLAWANQFPKPAEASGEMASVPEPLSLLTWATGVSVLACRRRRNSSRPRP